MDKILLVEDDETLALGKSEVDKGTEFMLTFVKRTSGKLLSTQLQKRF